MMQDPAKGLLSALDGVEAQKQEVSGQLPKVEDPKYVEAMLKIANRLAFVEESTMGPIVKEIGNAKNKAKAIGGVATDLVAEGAKALKTVGHEAPKGDTLAAIAQMINNLINVDEQTGGYQADGGEKDQAFQQAAFNHAMVRLSKRLPGYITKEDMAQLEQEMKSGMYDPIQERPTGLLMDGGTMGRNVPVEQPQQVTGGTAA